MTDSPVAKGAAGGATDRLRQRRPGHERGAAVVGALEVAGEPGHQRHLRVATGGGSFRRRLVYFIGGSP